MTATELQTELDQLEEHIHAAFCSRDSQLANDLLVEFNRLYPGPELVGAGVVGMI